MPESPRYARQGWQVTLDELVFETEVIHGSMPADRQAAQQARDAFYQDLADGYDGSCLGDAIHIFQIGATRCMCAKKKENT